MRKRIGLIFLLIGCLLLIHIADQQLAKKGFDMDKLKQNY